MSFKNAAEMVQSIQKIIHLRMNVQLANEVEKALQQYAIINHDKLGKYMLMK